MATYKRYPSPKRGERTVDVVGDVADVSEELAEAHLKVWQARVRSIAGATAVGGVAIRQSGRTVVIVAGPHNGGKR